LISKNGFRLVERTDGANCFMAIGFLPAPQIFIPSHFVFLINTTPKGVGEKARENQIFARHVFLSPLASGYLLKIGIRKSQAV